MIEPVIERIKSAAMAACLACACACLPAWAVLGGTADSVRGDAAAMKAQLTPRATAQSAYSVQRLTLDGGTLVDEYLSPAGQVFALHWQGAQPPSLTQLFGAYFDEYQAASTVPHQRRNYMQIDTGRMRYRSGGHMRALWGSAYVPALLPAGLSIEDLK